MSTDQMAAEAIREPQGFFEIDHPRSGKADGSGQALE